KKCSSKLRSALSPLAGGGWGGGRARNPAGAVFPPPRPPPPRGGGRGGRRGGGGGGEPRTRRVRLTPLPGPPPQGGRERRDCVKLCRPLRRIEAGIDAALEARERFQALAVRERQHLHQDHAGDVARGIDPVLAR